MQTQIAEKVRYRSWLESCLGGVILFEMVKPIVFKTLLLRSIIACVTKNDQLCVHSLYFTAILRQSFL